MGAVVRFPLKLRSPEPQPQHAGTTVFPFPFSRRRNLVERSARAMRGLTPDKAENYLNAVLDRLCAELNAIGLDCEDGDGQCAALCEFIEAVGKELHGPQFRLEEAAQ
ncbi:hypothetical protein ABIE89_007404 [Bradyrhizobium niftali]|uniref:DUF6074 family protein n=1 Tax=Bradyrhizobium niftali TaxID=2560055 RepID=UPI0038329C28